MGSKAFVLLGLHLAFVLLIASAVTARDLAETSTSEENTEEAKNTNEVEESKYPGGGFGGNNGGGFGGNNGGSFGGNNGHGGRGNRGGRYGGGYCRYRCCRRNYYGGCYRCCSYLGEAMDKEIEGQPHN